VSVDEFVQGAVVSVWWVHVYHGTLVEGQDTCLLQGAGLGLSVQTSIFSSYRGLCFWLFRMELAVWILVFDTSCWHVLLVHMHVCVQSSGVDC
jgi:hypothetical protein